MMAPPKVPFVAGYNNNSCCCCRGLAFPNPICWLGAWLVGLGKMHGSGPEPSSGGEGGERANASKVLKSKEMERKAADQRHAIDCACVIIAIARGVWVRPTELRNDKASPCPDEAKQY
jgi:hypothetical protein